MIKNSTDILLDKVPLMEQFYSVQGEGYYSGRPAVFIRLGGCDVGCVWCDVKESWEAENHPDTSISSILNFVKDSKTEFVVITGGEPAMYDLTSITDALHNVGVEIAIETSGCYTLTGHIDWVCFSPKKFKKPLDEIYHSADELKIIIFNKSDFEWAEAHASRVNAQCKLYLQVEWSKKDKLTDQIVDYVKANPKWNISIQTHKYLNVP